MANILGIWRNTSTKRDLQNCKQQSLPHPSSCVPHDILELEEGQSLVRIDTFAHILPENENNNHLNF